MTFCVEGRSVRLAPVETKIKITINDAEDRKESHAKKDRAVQILKMIIEVLENKVESVGPALLQYANLVKLLFPNLDFLIQVSY
jgi:hypothetical protein